MILRTFRFNITEFYMEITLRLRILYGSQKKLKFFAVKHEHIGLYNRGGECLLRGTD